MTCLAVSSAADKDDRIVRGAILSLQKRGVPILASAGSGGYCLIDNERKLDSYLAELRSRQSELGEKIKGLESSRRTVRALREYPVTRSNQHYSIHPFTNGSECPAGGFYNAEPTHCLDGQTI